MQPLGWVELQPVQVAQQGTGLRTTVAPHHYEQDCGHDKTSKSRTCIQPRADLLPTSQGTCGPTWNQKTLSRPFHLKMNLPHPRSAFSSSISAVLLHHVLLCDLVFHQSSQSSLQGPWPTCQSLHCYALVCCLKPHTVNMTATIKHCLHVSMCT